MKGGKVPGTGERLAASQGELCSMDLAVVYLMTHVASNVLMILMGNDLEMMGGSCRVKTENTSLELSCRG
jgi:hypothetical protein